MSQYVTYYAVVEPAEITPDLMMLNVGTTDDGLTVYACLDDTDSAALHVSTCESCYASKTDLLDAYPELARTTTIELADGYVDVPRLSGRWA